MVSQRNRILNIIDYLESQGCEVNFNKNKARGNKGFFLAQKNKFRIDVAKGLKEDAVLATLAHEFAHFVHYANDKTLQNLEFIFSNYNDDLLEELLCATVEIIPKNTVKPLFDTKESLKGDIKQLIGSLSEIYPTFTPNKPFKTLENKFNLTPYKHLLKYDKVKVVEFFNVKYYSVEDLDNVTDFHLYLKLKSKQRALRRIESRISKLNKYYNSPTELFARSFELYLTNKDVLKRIAPNVYIQYEEVLKNNRIPILCDFIKIFTIN